MLILCVWRTANRAVATRRGANGSFLCGVLSKSILIPYTLNNLSDPRTNGTTANRPNGKNIFTKNNLFLESKGRATVRPFSKKIIFLKFF